MRHNLTNDHYSPAFEAETLNAIANFVTLAANDRVTITNMSATMANLAIELAATNDIFFHCP